MRPSEEEDTSELRLADCKEARHPQANVLLTLETQEKGPGAWGQVRADMNLWGLSLEERVRILVYLGRRRVTALCLSVGQVQPGLGGR